MNRIEILLQDREWVSRRRALNSPLFQGSAELVQYFADFTPWGAGANAVSSPVIKVIDQDGVDVTYGDHVSVVTAAPVAGGTGYAVDDVLILTDAGSSGDATVTVTEVTGGVIDAVELTDVGYNYTTGTKDTTGAGNSDATIAITAVTAAELVVKASVSVVNDIEVQFNMTNVVAGDRYRVFIKGTVNSLIEEAWIYIDGEV